LIYKPLHYRAQEGDNSLIEELHNLLLNPYDEQSTEAEKKWFKKTPLWARSKFTF
jgi:hypothetical protein